MYAHWQTKLVSMLQLGYLGLMRDLSWPRKCIAGYEKLWPESQLIWNPKHKSDSIKGTILKEHQDFELVSLFHVKVQKSI